MFLRLGDHQINYRIAGEGSPVLLIHGWAASLESLQSIEKDLSEYFTVYSLDLPGFGNSSPLNTDVGSEDYSQIVSDFLDKLEVTNPIVIGHSLGGKIASFLTTKTKIQGLVLIGSPGIKMKGKSYQQFRKSIIDFSKSFVEQTLRIKKGSAVHEMLTNLVGSSDYKKAQGNMKEIFKRVINEDLQHIYIKIDLPTLIIHGDRDGAVSLEVGEKIHKLIKNSELVIVEAGHFPFVLPKVRKQIVEFALDLIK